MTATTDPSSDHPSSFVRNGFWRKLGGGSLSISLMLHIILLAIGVIWIFQVIPPPSDNDVDFQPKSGGGGHPDDAQTKTQQVKMSKANMPRVSATDFESNLVLPETEDMSQMTALTSLGRGSLSNGASGPGHGGGRGPGDGPGDGPGKFPGNSNGLGSKNPFGMIDGNLNALAGTFYDLKQTKDGKATNMTDDEMRQELPEIVRRGFKDKVLSKYFKAPRKLYQSKLAIPIMSAEAAPAAFECEKEVQPRRWLVTYRGSIQAPHAGRYRFVGLSDDLLVIRFNNRAVFDYGYTIAGTGTHVYGRSAELDGTKPNAELQKDLKRHTPMPVPFKFYKYAKTPRHNELVGGFAVGPEFEVRANTTYPIEILIGEIPGGFFSVNLMIEEIGVNYEKDPLGGAPILPLFRLDNSLPDPDANGEAPPIDPNGPVWKFISPNTPDDI